MKTNTILIILSSLFVGLIVGMAIGYLIGFESAINTSIEALNLLDIKVDNFNVNFNETKAIDYMVEVMGNNTLK